MTRSFSFLIVLVLFTTAAFSQDTLIFLSGKMKIVDVKEINTRLLYVSYHKVGKPESKAKGVDMLEVFSVAYKDSTKVITYTQDTNLGLPLTVDEMQSYINGERYAIKNHKGVGYWIGGAVVGFSGPYFIGNLFYGILIPAAYTGLTGVMPAGTRSLAKKEPGLYADKKFVEGYKHKAKRKNVMASLYGSLIGVGVAAIATTILIMNE